MEKHVFDRSLQTSGSACLYYVVDTFQNESATVLQRYDSYLKRLLITILRAMNTHLHHSPVCFLTEKKRNETKNRFNFIHLDDSQRFINNFSNSNASSKSYRKIFFRCFYASMINNDSI